MFDPNFLYYLRNLYRRIRELYEQVLYSIGIVEFSSNGILVEKSIVQPEYSSKENWSILSKSKQLLIAFDPTPLIIV